MGNNVLLVTENNAASYGMSLLPFSSLPTLVRITLALRHGRRGLLQERYHSQTYHLLGNRTDEELCLACHRYATFQIGITLSALSKELAILGDGDDTIRTTTKMWHEGQDAIDITVFTRNYGHRDIIRGTITLRDTADSSCHGPHSGRSHMG
jgi:hypothetical protein